MKYSFLLNKTYHEWGEPFITEAELRNIGNISPDSQFYLITQGQDEIITGKNPVDLGREGIEQIYSSKGEKYQFIINEKLFISHEPTINEQEIRVVGRIPQNDILFFKVEGPDREIRNGQIIDLKPYPIEQFYSCKSQNLLVKITINTKDFEVKPGKYTVEQIKQIGHVKDSHTLDQIIDGKPVELKAGQEVTIKGCEIFCSQPQDGSSS